MKIRRRPITEKPKTHYEAAASVASSRNTRVKRGLRFGGQTFLFFPATLDRFPNEFLDKAESVGLHSFLLRQPDNFGVELFIHKSAQVLLIL